MSRVEDLQAAVIDVDAVVSIMIHICFVESYLNKDTFYS